MFRVVFNGPGFAHKFDKPHSMFLSIKSQAVHSTIIGAMYKV